MKKIIPAETEQEILATAFRSVPQQSGRVSPLFGRLALNAGLMDMVDQYIIRSSLGLPCVELAERLTDVITIGMEEYSMYPRYIALLQESLDLMRSCMPISLFQRYDLNDLFRRVQTNLGYSEKILRYFKQHSSAINLEYLHKSFWKYGMSNEYLTSYESILYRDVIDSSIPA